ncbi:hypothetical protein Y032_0026g1429 [Ancylostoma ceylanicum]|uniref:Uncharacterized protein n=1 Tax=Ancylostoma ceylanicum TaxID=53326 RepID=A0A016UWN2_9BILA|nr:hypothetical protein Y032_0026g1429 [Ancylostoma ceylanicum]
MATKILCTKTAQPVVYTTCDRLFHHVELKSCVSSHFGFDPTATRADSGPPRPPLIPTMYAKCPKWPTNLSSGPN